MNATYRIYFCLLLGLGFAYAARPMITDDARVVDKNSCQLETWGVYDGDIGEYWAIPGCNMIFDTEISLGGMMSNAYNVPNGSSALRGEQFIMGAKKIFSDLESKGFSYGIALGNAYNFRRSLHRYDYYAYIPASVALRDNTLLLHANLGYKLQYELNKRQIYNVGLGIEQQLTRYLWILGEGFYERFDRAKYQVGLRIWLLQDSIQLDATYGNAFAGKQSFVSMGLRFLSPALF
ncbi:hypothetical protein LS71_005740 [Helicobacter jaachi]|uniref:Outer membrane beta-barrel protein n=2 Tax=Helicobacter jaachi TaxID=1677920 RepID=A0A4U8T9Z9_9HELI|nr:hypothetical protein LS71_005740 [Helicobacter jaachi]